MGEFSNKVVLVTGGTRGIGRAIAEAFLREGAKVAVTYARSDDKARELEKMGILAIKCDVANRDEVRRVAEIVGSRLGDVSVLVNNAGVMYLMPFESYNEELFDRMIGVNLKGIIYTTLEFLPQLKRTRGAIINIASNAGIGTAFEGTTYYAITKAAVIILTKRMAFELGKYGIRVNAVAPGWVETDMTTANRTPEEIEKTKALVRSRTMLNTTGVPEDIANVVLFLASERARYITGQTIVADGGRIDYLTHGI
ncbi:glucose 1-dehydrogenase [Vulcanisaeta distributa]|uniref:Short-chain dehydrogenase/reductase SDR n=1 Tax=Vulcanisaeta distributa (strain DSM 14429 / JCM 11212 / NBRC 100878 / IC-017) TaxID=572478 RepID=E1QRJ4_VULDI|nr:glucose 1-dehydrogenase [Vulcanisaeta distributa]ADN51808.1 short-chain dehydrogenase/reductase SDR [Vulcanisaeta distributa DSM 14429]